MMRRSFLVVALSLTLGWAGRSDAAFATYTETVTGSGTFNGTSFTNALITITGTGDTNNIFAPAGFPGVLALNLTTNTVTVAGFAPASFTLPSVQVAVNQAVSTGGFVYGPNGTNILGTANNAFASYNLATSIGPLSGVATVNSGLSLTTTGGNLVINTASGNATFAAVVTPAGVPEPASAALVGLGLASLGALVRPRRRS